MKGVWLSTSCVCFAIGCGGDDKKAANDGDSDAADTGGDSADAPDGVDSLDAPDTVDSVDTSETPDTADTSEDVSDTTDSDAGDCAVDGTPCGADSFCVEGDCRPGCLVDAIFTAIGAPSPFDPCVVCDPSTTTSEYVPGPNGALCDGGFCLDGACTSGCLIDDEQVDTGVEDPELPCFVCAPAQNTFAWSAHIDGASCGDGQYCSQGACLTGCAIDGEFHHPTIVNPADSCERCDPATSTTSWTPFADGSSCGPSSVCVGGECTPGCWIVGTFYALGDENPFTGCQTCEPESSDDLVDKPAGTACGTGGICYLGSCNTACYIDGNLYLDLVPNPADPCQRCNPAASTSAFTANVDGTACGAHEVCVAGECEPGCVVDGTHYAPGESDPLLPCLVCNPAFSTSQWATQAAGIACESDKVCAFGNCERGCHIAGQYYQPTVRNSLNPCTECDPDVSTTAWSPVDNGTFCGFGEVCTAGECAGNCFIDGVTYDSGERDPANPCQVCSPTLSTSAWTVFVNHTSCGPTSYCESGSCSEGCLILGQFHPEGEIDDCRVCDPALSTTTWTQRDNGIVCGDGAQCVNGACSEGCVFAGEFYADGQPYGDLCRLCDSGTSLTEPSLVADGTSCGGDRVCMLGVCQQGCYVDGRFVAANAVDPANECRSCQPVRSTTEFSATYDGQGCSTGTCVSAECVEQPVFTSITPSCGVAGQARQVRIRGDDFAPGARVKFGGSNSASVNVLSPTELIATTPITAPPGFVDVAVANAIGDSAEKPDAFYFHDFFHLSGARSFATESRMPAVAVGDVNGDVYEDLVVSSPTGFTIYPSDGRGGLASATQVSVAGAAPDDAEQGIFVERLNGDGFPDVMRVSHNRIDVLPGRGDGTFGDPILTARLGCGNFVQLAPGDLDGDSELDFFFSCNGSYVSLLGQGDGTFSAVSTAVGTYHPRVWVLGDFDDNGQTDVAAADGFERLVVYRGLGDGTFSIGSAKALGGAPKRMRSADLDDDGKLDVVIGEGDAGIEVFYGLGLAEFTDGVPVAPGMTDWYSSPLDVADLNFDGIPELLVHHQTSLHVMIGTGDRAQPFACDYVYAADAESLSWDLVTRELDGDGNPDVIITYWAPSVSEAPRALEIFMSR